MGSSPLKIETSSTSSKVPAAMIGIQPSHFADTFNEAMAFLDAAHNRFAVGLIGRELRPV